MRVRASFRLVLARGKKDKALLRGSCCYFGSPVRQFAGTPVLLFWSGASAAVLECPPDAAFQPQHRRTGVQVHLRTPEPQHPATGALAIRRTKPPRTGSPAHWCTG